MPHPLFNLSAAFCYLSTAVFNNCYSELMPYTAVANSYWASFHNAFNTKATPINNTDYICHITAVELV